MPHKKAPIPNNINKAITMGYSRYRYGTQKYVPYRLIQARDGKNAKTLFIVTIIYWWGFELLSASQLESGFGISPAVPLAL